VTNQEKVRVKTGDAAIQLGAEYSVPWFWPYAAAIELGEEGLEIFGERRQGDLERLQVLGRVGW